MEKSTAFAVATMQGHKLGKNPKGYGTKEGKKVARRKFNKPRKEYVKTPNPRELESPKMAAMRAELEKMAKNLAGGSPYLLDKMHIEPKVRQRRADAPEPKHRVKMGSAGRALVKAGMQTPGVFGQPTQMGAQSSGGAMDPAKQLANSQKVGAPKLQGPKMKTLSMKTASGDMVEYFSKHPKKFEEWKARHKEKRAGVKDVIFKALRGGRKLPSEEEAFDEFASIAAQQGDISVEEAKKNLRAQEKKAFAVSQYSGTLGGGTRDIYRPSDAKYGGPPPMEGEGKKKSKVDAMADELAKLNGVATTPAGKLYQSQRVGAPKMTPPPGPSISELSKPVGYGTKAPGAVKGTI